MFSNIKASLHFIFQREGQISPATEFLPLEIIHTMRCESSDGWEEITPRAGADVKTIVLVGKTGNGKSATGNTVIGRQVFDSMPSLGGVTSTCQFSTTVLDDGQILNVIDTPGLFDSAVKPHDMAKEIAQCINMAQDGIHAVLLVVSLRSRFSEEEASAFESLCQIFGGKIADYMIVVFSHGDVLGKYFSLDDMLARNCPDLLKRTLEMCGDRRISFDNFTEDETKICRQRRELVSLVDAVVENNGGKPYTNDLFEKFKNRENLVDSSAEGTSRASNEQQFDRFIEMVELRLKESIHNLEKQLAEERAARMEAELKALELQTKSKDEVQELKDSLNRAEESRKNLEGRLHAAENKVHCVIM